MVFFMRGFLQAHERSNVAYGVVAFGSKVERSKVECHMV
jgi:hypothetical protein